MFKATNRSATLFAVLLLTAFCSFSEAIPIVRQGLAKRLPSGSDPSYSLSESTLAAGLTCSSGSPSSATKPILLVPGTGNNGTQSFDSNWIPLSQQLGYTPCWISPPPYMLNDSQTNAEYVVYAVSTLYSANGGNKVPVLTWSQGGLVTQWALVFFPSTRTKIDRLMAFAPDYKGTTEAYFLDVPGLASQSVWQQTSGSAYVTALNNAGGLSTIVPTTNLWSTTDEIVQPQFTGTSIDSSYLTGAKNVHAQDICGPTFIIDHQGSLTSQFSYVVGKSALASSTGMAQSSDYGITDCIATAANPLTSQQKADSQSLLVVATENVLAGPKQNCEPDLMPYARPYAVGKVTCSGATTA